MKKIEMDLLSYVIVILMLSVILVMEELIFLALIPLLLYLFPSFLRVSVLRYNLSEITYVGDEFHLNAELKAIGFGYIEIEHDVDGVIVTSGVNRTGGFVPFFRRFNLRYGGKVTKRGVINFGIFKLKEEDVFLLKTSYKKIDLGISKEIRVRVMRIRKVKSRRIRTRETLPDIDISRIGVPGTDFREIRDYKIGDPLKFINWKATARKGKLLTNEFEVEGKRAVWFFVNTSEDIFNEREYLDNALMITASLSYHYLKRGHKVALTLTGNGKTIHPDVGNRQFYRILKELTYAEFGEKSPLDAFFENRKLVMYHMPFVIYVTSIHDSLALTSELLKLRLNYRIFVVKGLEYENELAKRVERILERAKIRSGAYLSSGIPVVSL